MNIYEFTQIDKFAVGIFVLSLITLQSPATAKAWTDISYSPSLPLHANSALPSPFRDAPSNRAVSYRDFAMTSYDLKAGALLFIEGYVKNTGDRAGEEVVQVYLSYPALSSEPPMQLKAFQKLWLEPGDEKRVILSLSPKDYSFWSPGTESWMVQPGDYQVSIGPSADDIRYAKLLKVRGGSLDGRFYQAEEASLDGGAEIAKNHAGYAGAGFVNAMTAVGASLGFQVDVPASGAYRVSLRYANSSGEDRGLSIYVNGEKVRRTFLPFLANWETWNYKTESLYLNEGSNTISYRYDEGDSGNINLDGIIVNESPNLALHKAVTASSVESDETPPHYAVDGDPSTHWSSSFSDSQWLQIDLGEAFIIDSVVLKWESAFARSYTIERSLDGKVWKQLYYTSKGDGNVDEVNGLNTKIIPDQTRYLRVNTLKHDTEFGVSLWDFEVYASQPNPL